MSRLPKALVLATVLGLAASTGYAQSSDSNITFQSGLLSKRQAAGLPDVKPQPQAWPRLDPGAALCRTEDDLDRLVAHRRGQDVNGPIDCQLIRSPTAINILERKGPGRTEVSIRDVKSSGLSGWTDVWLPAKAPAGASTASK